RSRLTGWRAMVLRNRVRVLNVYPYQPKGPWLTEVEQHDDTQTAKETVTEFCEETSFHGFKYFVKRDLSIPKRVFWAVSWVASLTACCYYIGQNISEYKDSPILTTIDSTAFPISKVDFPSVTFCNFNHIVKSRHPPAQETVVGRSASHPLDTFEPLVVFSGGQSAQRCEDMVLFCLWRGTVDCAGLFTQVSTRNGFCCVINVADTVTKPPSPARCPGDSSGTNSTTKTGARVNKVKPNIDLSSAGVNQGLTVLLDAQVYEYTYSTYHSVGFKMHLQEPTGPPGLSHEGVVVSPGKEVFIPVQAFSTFTTRAALQLRPNERKCFLNSERRLKNYANVYSHEACVLDQRTIQLLKACGCRDYHMPGEEDVCLSQEQIGCVREFAANWHMDPAQVEQISEACYSGCNSTTYLATPSYASLPTPYMEKTWLGLRFLIPTIKTMCRLGYFNKEQKVGTSELCYLRDEEELEHLLQNHPDVVQDLTDYLEKNGALVHVYFEYSTSTLYKRDIVATASQIVANIGGLLGLFLGFSLLSGAEIIFYLYKLLAGSVRAYVRTRGPSQVQGSA
ncbi:Pickpocket protein 28-like 1, partial [Homarus americanus]